MVNLPSRRGLGPKREPHASPAAAVGALLRSNLLATAALLLAFGAGMGSGCAGTDQKMDTLGKELEGAKAKAARQPKAECYPSSQEPCYSGPEGAINRGVCKEGVKACDPGGFWLACEGEVLPAPKELCNAIDDDCNGITDDGFKATGTKCWIGKGQCRSEGTYSCTADGSKSVCSAAVIAPSQESCDGKDNDCDGQVDNGNIPGTGDSCATGRKGVCSAGRRTCQTGAIVCEPSQQPGAEICNKIDDDCDGQVDEECISEADARAAGIIK